MELPGVGNAPDELDGASGLDENNNPMTDNENASIDPERIVREARHEARVIIASAKADAKVILSGVWSMAFARAISPHGPVSNTTGSAVSTNYSVDAAEEVVDPANQQAVNDDEVLAARTEARIIVIDANAEAACIRNEALTRRALIMAVADWVSHWARLFSFLWGLFAKK